MMPILFALYSIIITSLIWARFGFFKVSSIKSRRVALIYDCLVAIQIIVTFAKFYTAEPIKSLIAIIAGCSYLSCLWFFWFAILKVRQLDFAFGVQINRLLIDGPYKFVRHPFYSCYIAIWLTSTLLFNSAYLWITLVSLTAFYYIAAKSEEDAIYRSSYSEHYRRYSANVGMLLPRIYKWKS